MTSLGIKGLEDNKCIKILTTTIMAHAYKRRINLFNIFLIVLKIK